MAINQIEQSLKFELLIALRATARPTACMSFNYHCGHFGIVWNLHGADGETAHTACIAFGMDRLALALFHTHGLDLSGWPAGIRAELMI